MYKVGKGDARVDKIPTMLNALEASRAVNLDYKYILRLCRQDEIVYRKNGNIYLINLEKLIDYLNGEDIKEVSPKSF